MGRPSVYKLGDFYGKLEITEIIPTNKTGHSVKLRCLCHFCGKETIIKANHNQMKKRKSCGCQQHNSDSWKRKGAIVRSWQLPFGEASRRHIEYSYKRCASKRNLEYLLTTGEFTNLVTSPCYYCGNNNTSCKKGQGKTSGDFYYTGIDRIDSKKGYTKENVVPCCWMCNNMKSNYEKGAFIEHIEKIYLHTKIKE